MIKASHARPPEAPTDLPAPSRGAHRSQIAGVVIGTALEFYDFQLYAYFAVQIGRSFFPSASAQASLLAALATFAAGFIMRPVGALGLGWIGDRVGRKPAMLFSFGLMGVAMLGMALTPAYSSIGIAAPLLAIAWRMLQGFALGGEVGSTTTYLIEIAPPARRGLYVSLQVASQRAATLVSGVLGFALASSLSETALTAWGWRLAFLAGAAVVPLGLVLRRQISETLDRASVGDIIGESPRGRGALALAVLAIAIVGSGAIASYVLDYVKTYATHTLSMPSQTGFLAVVALGGSGLLAAPLGGLLSDRIGRTPVMAISWSLLLASTIPGFAWVVATHSEALLIAVIALLGALWAMTIGPIMTSLAEGLPAHIRCGGMGLAYALGTSIFGGSTQFTVAWLTGVTGNPMAPAWYMTGGIVMGLLAILLLRETAPLKQEAARPRLERAAYDGS